MANQSPLHGGSPDKMIMERGSYMSPRQLEVYDVVGAWLLADHKKQFENSGPMIAARRDALLSIEIPEGWRQFQQRRNELSYDQDPDYSDDSSVDPQALLNVGWSALKVAGAAREALIWSGILRGRPPYQAHNSAHDLLKRFREKLIDGSIGLPPRRLLHPGFDIVGVVNTYAGRDDAYTKPTVLLARTVGLTVTALLEQDHETREVVVPLPGTDWSENLQRWHYRRK